MGGESNIPYEDREAGGSQTYNELAVKKMQVSHTTA
jgi:hypothetical protein